MARRTLVIAGTHSGVGKTTVALALMAALRQRGLVIQPFKVGPDFIDPGHHSAVCGRPSRNLDTWMLSEAVVRSTFARASMDADVALIEGAMGLFDGRGWNDLRGSTADIARLLEAPVILVVDAKAVGGSIAAVVKGFSEFHPSIRVAGVVCNRVAGPGHYEYLETAIRNLTSVESLGWLPRRPEWTIAERHLGLVTAADLNVGTYRWDQLGQALEKMIDVDHLLDLAGIQPREKLTLEPESALLLPGIHKRVAVARDAAFCFYYPENLELLVAAGGEVVPFSPLKDASLPLGSQILYLGGGYPELHAKELAVNKAMRESIRRFHRQGGTIYAECGGLMYACRDLIDGSGTVFPMLGLLPARTMMQPQRAALGYISLRTQLPSPLGPVGTTARGHEFHYSRLEVLEPVIYAAELDSGRGTPRPDMLLSENLLAGYAHLHFGSNSTLALALLQN